MKWPIFLLCALLSSLSSLHAQQRPTQFPNQSLPRQEPGSPQKSTVVKILDDVSISFPHNWRPGVVYTNATELVRFAPEDDRRQLGRIMVYTERRQDHKEAVQRLAEIAANQKNAGIEFFIIDGWPALERWYLAPLRVRGRQQPVQERTPSQLFTPNDNLALWLTTAIAYREFVIRFEATFMPGIDLRIANEVRAARRTLQLRQRDNSKEAELELDALRRGDYHSFESLRPLSKEAFLQLERFRFGGRRLPASTLSLAPNGFSEIEIAASGNGMQVVIATNGPRASLISFSTNGGATFNSASLNVGTLGFPVTGDPSVARGASGTFYLAQIGFPDGSTAAGGVTGCSTVISASPTLAGTNGGFTFRAHAAFCPTTGPGICFPDQEHIAADTVNLGPSGDQVYSAWRNFTPLLPGTPSCAGIASGVVAQSIACSTASGMSWGTPTFIGSGDFPRITVGSDGFVYVVYMEGAQLLISKFSSCAAGLVPVAGFPIRLDEVRLSDCPAGLDRCGETVLTSPMVAVDDTNPAHVFVAYAKPSSSINDQILLIDSNDGGLTWTPGALPINDIVTARRFMPWVCATDGTAWVSWYDRRSATSAAPDLTEYFLGGAYRKGGSWFRQAERNLSGGTPDPQCAPGFPSGARDVSAAEGCPVQPQNAGVCRGLFGLGGSGTACDFSSGACPFGETCQPGMGSPNWGDYNGNACASGRIFTAWASGTAPMGLTALSPGAGIRTFTEVTQPSTVLYVSLRVEDNWPGAPTQGRFNILLDGTSIANNVGTHGTGARIVTPGAHQIRLTAAPGTNLSDYTRQFSGDCAPVGDVIVARGRAHTCNIVLTNFNYLNTSGCRINQKCCEPGTGAQTCRLCIASTQSCP